MNAVDVVISEVGPRDGLQNTKSFMPTAAKKAWISAEAAQTVTVSRKGLAAVGGTLGGRTLRLQTPAP